MMETSAANARIWLRRLAIRSVTLPVVYGSRQFWQISAGTPLMSTMPLSSTNGMVATPFFNRPPHRGQRLCFAGSPAIFPFLQIRFIHRHHKQTIVGFIHCDHCMQRLTVEQSAQDKTIRQGAMLGRIILDHFAVFQRLFHVTAIPVFVCQFSNGMARPENLASFRVTLILPGLLTDKILFSARHNSNHSM